MNNSSFKKILSKYGDNLVELEIIPNNTPEQLPGVGDVTTFKRAIKLNYIQD